MAGNPPREDPGPPYVATPARSGASRMCPLSSSLHKLGAHLQPPRDRPPPPLRARLGWREPVRAVNTSCPATTARALHADHLVVWHARACKGGNQLIGAGGRGGGTRLGAPATETGGSCARRVWGARGSQPPGSETPHPTAPAVLMAVHWAGIGQASSQWAGCAPPKPVALPHCLRRGRCSESLTSQWCPALVLTSTTASLRASLRAPVMPSSPGVHFPRASPSASFRRISFRRVVSGRSTYGSAITTYGSQRHCTPPARFHPPCQRYRSGRHRSSHHPFLRLPRYTRILIPTPTLTRTPTLT